MTRIIYSTIASLDGYTVDAGGGFDWAAPSVEVHAFINDIEREVGAYVYGRRMYETMRAWQTMATADDDSGVTADFAELWRRADKVVVSTTLAEVSTPRTALVRTFDPDALRELAAAANHPVSIGGPTLAGHALRAGIVDEVRLFLVPVTVGGGTPTFPLDLMLALELRDERHFPDGTVYLRYAVKKPRPLRE
jgi:dihydrofolate reductase